MSMRNRNLVCLSVLITGLICILASPKVMAESSFRDCSDCPEMVIIPAGEYNMGDNRGDGRENERPTKAIHIGYELAVAKYEVTIAQFETFVHETRYMPEPGCAVYNGKRWKNETLRNWRNPGYLQAKNHPVTCVNWADAKAYTEWLSNLTEHFYRLPSESEWEYAARAGSISEYSFGDDEQELCLFANGADLSTNLKWRNTACNDGFGMKPAPAGNFLPNAFGLYDMHGNLFEWMEDCWQEKAFLDVPADGTPVSGVNCTHRSLRGGSWLYPANYLRSSFRFNEKAENRLTNIGFRVVRPVR